MCGIQDLSGLTAGGATFIQILALLGNISSFSSLTLLGWLAMCVKFQYASMEWTYPFTFCNSNFSSTAAPRRRESHTFKLYFLSIFKVSNLRHKRASAWFYLQLSISHYYYYPYSFFHLLLEVTLPNDPVCPSSDAHNFLFSNVWFLSNRLRFQKIKKVESVVVLIIARTGCV